MDDPQKTTDIKPQNTDMIDMDVDDSDFLSQLAEIDPDNDYQQPDVIWAEFRKKPKDSAKADE